MCSFVNDWSISNISFNYLKFCKDYFYLLLLLYESSPDLSKTPSPGQSLDKQC